jgi:hypothetical protein
MQIPPADPVTYPLLTPLPSSAILYNRILNKPGHREKRPFKQPRLYEKGPFYEE